jgi:oligopeptide/dipeptide ABC transporter ATP-binding protein
MSWVAMPEIVLDVQDLRTSFDTDEGLVKAVDGVSFQLARGKILGLVGESGSGKSATALSIMRLIPDPPGRIEAGRINFHGENLLDKPEADMRQIRGARISMIFQDPMTSLDPVFTIGQQLTEALIYHQRLKKKEAFARSVEMLRLVGIPSPEARMRNYPHEFSGGMQQRVMIAMGLLCRPDLLLADEPTTALDVTVELQILELLQEIRQQLGTSIILITHDLRVVVNACDEVAVMYAGNIVERGPVQEVFGNPQHPYTLGLMASIPRPGLRARLQPIPGRPPNLIDLPPGCRFVPRCPEAIHPCQEAFPTLVEVSSGHRVRCIRRGPHV